MFTESSKKRRTKPETMPRNKHQERTEATQVKLLQAAEGVFTRDGFANAKLEEIAEHAGYTRGAIYAHYKSKEDLFLALFEQRALAKKAKLLVLLAENSTREERLRKFRALLVGIAADRSWALLMLEFKLFALRQPKLKARMRRIHAMLHSTMGEELLERLFGEGKAEERHRIKRRCSLIGSVVSAAVLESHFRPELLSRKDLDEVLGELIAAVVRR